MDATMKREEVENVYKDEKQNLPKCKVLICGYTGSGKTTLIQKIFGKEVVDDSRIGDGMPTTQGYDEYSHGNLTVFDSRGLENGESEHDFYSQTQDFLKHKALDGDLIHFVWYCIQGPGARVTECDIRLIKLFESTHKTLVLITKNDITKDKQKQAMRSTLIENGIPDDAICSVDEDNELLLNELLEKTLRLLPEAHRDALAIAQQINLEKKNRTAQIWIHAAAASATAAGAIPIPMSDAIVITPIQTGLIARLCFLYDLENDIPAAAFWPLVAKVAGVFTAQSLIKLIPGLGSLISAAVAGALTEALGQLANMHLKHCFICKRDGKDIPDFDYGLKAFMDIYSKVKKKQPIAD